MTTTTNKGSKGEGLNGGRKSSNNDMEKSAPIEMLSMFTRTLQKLIVSLTIINILKRHLPSSNYLQI